MKYEIIKDYKESEFRSITGVTPATFNAMLDVVNEAYAQAHKRRGRHRKLSREDMLLMMLEYYKEYRTQECIGASYGLKKSNVGKVIKWVEEALILSGLFSLPGKKALVLPDAQYEKTVVDTMETPIQRPKKGQKRYYSGKKRHTMKSQIMIDRRTEIIICTELRNGKAHDGMIFKQTTPVNPLIVVLADSGYRGIQKVHANTRLPIRHKEDIAKLSDEQKAERKARNKLISAERMKIEHIIGRIKVFKIIAERYRNHRKRLLLRLNLVCGIVNFQRPALD